MIRYGLVCDRGHGFEGWFRDSAGFDEHAAEGLLACAVCGSERVTKAIMAPRIAREGAPARDEAPAPPAEEAATSTPPGAEAPATLLSEPERRVRAVLRALRAHVVDTSDYVGPRFADEARRIHEGEVPHRAIYGEATPDEVRALVEDEIEVHPLPMLPEERN